MTQISRLVVKFVDGKHWELTEDLTLTTPAGDVIVVPAGFVTDFASIPRVFWSLIGDPGGPWAPAAVVHDYLYRTGLLPRAEADAIFRDVMAIHGIRGTKRWVMWATVRAAGWLAYEKDKRKTTRGEGNA